MSHDTINQIVSPRDWIKLNKFTFFRLLRYFTRRFITKPTCVNQGEVKLPTPIDLSTNAKIAIWSGGYEHAEISIIKSKIEKTDIILEVGAGIGYISTLCSKILGSKHVFAFEANPNLEKIIQKTYSLNNVSPTLSINGVGAKTEQRTFYIEENFYSSSFSKRENLIKRTNYREKSMIDVLSFHDLIEKIRPTFLIIDIEGAELEIFDGSPINYVKKICLEIHPDILGDMKCSQIITNIIKQGFSLSVDVSNNRVLFFHRQI